MNQWKRAIEIWFTGKEEQMVQPNRRPGGSPQRRRQRAQAHASPSGKAQPKRWEVALLQAQAAGLRAENQGGYVLTADLNDCPDELHILRTWTWSHPAKGGTPIRTPWFRRAI